METSAPLPTPNKGPPPEAPQTPPNRDKDSSLHPLVPVNAGCHHEQHCQNPINKPAARVMTPSKTFDTLHERHSTPPKPPKTPTAKNFSPEN